MRHLLLLSITLLMTGISLTGCDAREALREKFERSNQDVSSDISFGGGGGGGGGYSSRQNRQAHPTPPLHDTTKKPVAKEPAVNREAAKKPDIARKIPVLIPGKPEARGDDERLYVVQKSLSKKNSSRRARKSDAKRTAPLTFHNPSSKSVRRDPPGQSDSVLSGWDDGAVTQKPSRQAEKKVIKKTIVKKEEVIDLPPPSVSGDHESYDNHGVNPMTSTKKDRFSTFSIDVDTGSYAIARRKLTEGVTPPAASVRVEEFVNYFSYDYPAPEEGAFSVSFDGAPSPFRRNASRQLIRIGVQGKRLTDSERKPLHLVFLVDVSGSMNHADKLGLIKKSLMVLIENLKPDDTVALVTYAGGSKVALPPTKASDSIAILNGILNLSPGGGTTMSDGMKLAYDLAIKEVKPDHISRVIVLSDGDANIGKTTFKEILSGVQSHIEEGVTLSTIGFGMGNYKDNTMEQLANKGNGNYYYIDTIDEAKKVFQAQIDGTLQIIARDVKIQVEFDPELVKSYRLVGYENRDIADKDFRNDRVDAGEIGAGHSVTALYEVEFVADTLPADAKLATVHIRHKSPEGYDGAREQSFTLLRSHIAGTFDKGSDDFQFAVAVIGFAELLRGSPYARDFGFADIIATATQGAESKPERQEFLAIVERAQQLAN